MSLMTWFETLLVVATLGSGAVWLLDALFFAKRRKAQGGLLDEEPVLVDYSRAFFPVLAVVLVLRSFIAEPYKIPSSSMMPNLLIGDFILVNKFSYGLRLPITNQKFVAIGEPARGDVVVFKPPHAPENNWIKRVIGLPGDKVGFHGDTVYLNGQPLKYETLGEYDGADGRAEAFGATLLREDLPGRPHTILESVGVPPPGGGEGDWVVPPGHYFVMGDNRDNSLDGRFWDYHFLPEQNLRGKAFLVWLNCQGWFCKNGFDASRIGNGIE